VFQGKVEKYFFHASMSKKQAKQVNPSTFPNRRLICWPTKEIICVKIKVKGLFFLAPWGF
jgi:hypothetical protein